MTRQANDAALSHTSKQQPQQLFAADPAAFYQAGDHRQIREQRGFHEHAFIQQHASQPQRRDLLTRAWNVHQGLAVGRVRRFVSRFCQRRVHFLGWLYRLPRERLSRSNGSRRRGCRSRVGRSRDRRDRRSRAILICRRSIRRQGTRGRNAYCCNRWSHFRLSDGLAPPAIKSLLLPASLVGLIVFPAPQVGLPASTVHSTAERATQIPPTCIPRMREEANPAMATAGRTAFQVRMIAQDGIERKLILTNERASPIALMPILAKRENFGQRYDKNARFSVKMLILFCISSSYELDAKTSRRWARFFSARREKDSNQLAQPIPLLSTGQPQLPTHPDQLRGQLQIPALPGKKKHRSRLHASPNSSFPSSGSI